MNKLLKQLVNIDSRYPNEFKLGEFISDYLQAFNLTIEKINIGTKNQSRNNLLIGFRKTKFKNQKKILLYGHLDTVPIVGSWQTNPFNLTIINNKAYGLGAYDMKAGLAIILKLLTQNNDLPIKAIFSVDEENICQGAFSLKNHSFLEDIVFALVPEPNFGFGENSVCLGRTGRLVIQVYFKGDNNHLILANKSANAIREAQAFDNNINSLKFASNKNFGKTIIVPRALHSESSGLSIPGKALLEYDLLTTPPTTKFQALKEFKQLANNLFKAKKIKYLPIVKLKDRITPYLEPYEINSNNQYLRFIERGIKIAMRRQPKFYYRHSVADENVLVNVHKISSFTLGPSGGNAHSANEWVNLVSMEMIYKVYFEIIKQYALLLQKT